MVHQYWPSLEARLETRHNFHISNYLFIYVDIKDVIASQ